MWVRRGEEPLVEGLQCGVARAAKEGEHSEPAEWERHLQKPGGVVGVAVDVVETPAHHPHPACSPGQYWVGDTAHGEQEVEVRHVLHHQDACAETS